jgi:hypothetical protein
MSFFKRSGKKSRKLPKAERAALKIFSDDLGMENWKKSGGWEAIESAERVEGVDFREVDGVSYVVAIDLSNNNLVGRLPVMLGDLKCLETLILCENTITGTIPESLADCPHLSCMMLQRNKLIGKVPPGLLYKDGLNLQFDGTWKGVTPDISFVDHPVEQVLNEVMALGYSEAQAKKAFDSQPVKTASTEGCIDYLRKKGETYS